MIKIEKAGIKDAKEILALQKRAFEKEAVLYADFDMEPLIITLDETIGEFKRSLVLKLTIDGKIAGSVRGSAKGGVCTVKKLMVDPGMHNRGFGGALMNALEKEFAGCRKFRLITGYKSENNKHLYKKLGYKIIGKRKINDRLSMVEMEKTV